MNKVKTLIASAVIAGATLALIPLSADAQGLTYTPNSHCSINFTNPASTVATNYATTNQTIVSLGPIRAKSITVQLETQNDAAGAVNIITPYQLSTDGVSYNTALTFVTNSLNGTSKQVAVFNISLNGAGYIRFPYVTNSHATINMTNGWFRVPLNYNAP